MSFSFFAWIRAKARDAVLSGLADAAHELDAAEPGSDLENFRAMLAASAAKQLPPADEEPEPAKGRGKGGR